MTSSADSAWQLHLCLSTPFFFFFLGFGIHGIILLLEGNHKSKYNKSAVSENCNMRAQFDSALSFKL